MEDKNKNDNNYRWEIIKKIIEIIIIVMIIILLKYEYVDIERLIRVLYIILFISMYLFISYSINNILQNYIDKRFNKINYDEIKDLSILTKKEFQEEANKLDEEKFKYKDKVKKIVKVLVIIQNIINPILVFYMYLYEQLYYFFRWINLKIEKYKKIRWIIFKGVMSIFVKPIIRIYKFYYRILKRWRERTFLEIIFYRVEGLIISVLLLSDIYKYFNIWIYIILIYIFFFSVEFWPKKYTMRYKVLRDFCSWGFESVFDRRNESTIIGNIISILCEEFEIGIYANIRILDKEYVQTSSTEKKVYYLSHITNVIDCEEDIMWEIKNKPSYIFFLDLFYLRDVNKLDLTEIFLGVIKFKDEDLLRICQIYEKEKKRIKKIIYWMWEIEEWMGRERTKVFINEYYMMLRTTRNDNNEPIIEESKWTINNFHEIEGKKANFRDVKEFYDEIYNDVINDEWDGCKEDKKWIRETLEKYGISIPGIIHNGKEEKELFIKKIGKFLEEIDKEWVESTKNKKIR